MWADTVRWVLLGAVVALLAAASVRGDGWVPLVSHVDLGIHELGHMLLMWAPRDVAAFAGSFAQIAAPITLAVYFGFGRRDFAVAVLLLAWAGVSIRNVAVYMADANTRTLQLIGGQAGHDWAYLFGRWGALSHAEEIARTISAFGWLVFTVALALALWGFARPRIAVHEKAEYDAYRKALPVREPRNRPPAVGG
jgi:hypothetical protein